MNDNSEILVIGPSLAGKSVYLSAIVLATEQNWRSEHGLDDSTVVPASNQQPSHGRVAIFPANDNMRRLTKQARAFVEVGLPSIQATAGATDYEFDLEIKEVEQRSTNWLLRNFTQRAPVASKATRFRVIDHPGGSIFPSAVAQSAADRSQLSEYRNQILQQAKKSRGILILADANDDLSAGAYFHDLAELFEGIGRPLPFSRYVLVLTKAERLLPIKRGQEQRLAVLDPQPSVERLLPTVLRNIFDYKHDSAEVCCGWASAYGFIPTEGTPNYVDTPDGGARLRSVLPDMSLNDKLRNWRPFRVLDPLIFLASGIRGSLKRIEDRRY